MTTRTRTRRYIAVIIALAVGAAGCSIEEQSIPPLSGPSELGMSIALTATPNQLPRDGSSQSVVTLVARDAQGRAISGQRIRLTLPTSAPSGTSLTVSEVTTDPAGQATFGVIAPSQSSIGNSIVVTATPEGANLDSVLPRQISITVTPNNSTRPTPSFTVSPTTPEINQLVTFNATGTTDEGTACNENCTYEWNFGGEGTATGRIVTHRFQSGGRYVVALTAIDAQGAVETVRQNVDVSTLGPPTVSFSVSPTAPVAGRAATFTATATPAANHRIVSYDWSWGDGETSQSQAANIQHTFNDAGVFLVRLSVRDDLGQRSEFSAIVTVSSGLSPSFFASPTNPQVGASVFFDASASSSQSGSAIASYTWNFGDGSAEETTTTPIVTKAAGYAATGTYTVRLTITDGEGRSASTTTTVTVVP